MSGQVSLPGGKVTVKTTIRNLEMMYLVRFDDVTMAEAMLAWGPGVTGTI